MEALRSNFEAFRAGSTRSTPVCELTRIAQDTRPSRKVNGTKAAKPQSVPYKIAAQPHALGSLGSPMGGWLYGLDLILAPFSSPRSRTRVRKAEHRRFGGSGRSPYETLIKTLIKTLPGTHRMSSLRSSTSMWAQGEPKNLGPKETPPEPNWVLYVAYSLHKSSKHTRQLWGHRDVRIALG